MADAKDGKEAITHFKVLERYKNKYTLLQINLETGRTHQIRVHLSHIGYPIIGDEVYSNGKNEWNVSGQCLHAWKLEFIHPITGEKISLEAEIPEYLKNIIKELIQESKELNIKFRTGDPTLIPIFPEVFGIDIKEAEKYYAGCEAGDEIIYIDFKGNVGACSYIPIFADNIKDKSLDEILEKNKLFITLKQYKENLKGKCRQCTYKSICGGCRATALALKNSLLEEDPLCLL